MESSLPIPNLIPVQPVRPPAGYIGGKRNLSRRLVAMIDAIDHTLYAEPFVGMGGVFFRRRRRPRAEFINDVSKDVTTLFRILQRHYAAFLEELRFTITSRAEFDRLMAIALPRVRDFKGVSPKGFDGRGNYTLGLRDQLLFPEIDYMKVDKARGMNVSVVTTAKTDEEARKLLQFIGMPFRQ